MIRNEARGGGVVLLRVECFGYGGQIKARPKVETSIKKIEID